MKTKLTEQYNALVAKIAADTAKAKSILENIGKIDFIAGLSAGAAVVVKLGRKFADKDTTRYVDGTIMAKKEDEKGNVTFKVMIGSGFDADVAVVGAADVFAEGYVPAPVAEDVQG